MMKASLLYKCTNETGEAVTWLHEREELLWTDIDNGLLHRYIPAKQRCVEYRLHAMVSTVVPIKENFDEVLLALPGEIIIFNLNDGSHRILVKNENNLLNYRPNDGKASPEGRLWLGIMHLSNHKHTGSLWCLGSTLSLQKMLNKQCIPNGMVWNEKGDKMYYADSGRACIEEYEYDVTSGNIRFLRVVIQVPPAYGVPDGMAIDSRGMLWVAHWGGFGVYVWNPKTGALEDKIELPVPNVASCAFGGKNNQRLFITTARAGLDASQRERYPLSGSLFCADVEIRGENFHSFVLR